MSEELQRIHQVANVMVDSQFFNHRSAALLWGAPVPHQPGALIHASVQHVIRAPRVSGVVGHSLLATRCAVTEREGFWSPQESRVRVALIRSGAPEPELNGDVFDAASAFLGCVDLLYRKYKVGIEYQGTRHAERYAADVERLAAFRADHREMIEVTSALAGRREVLVGRVMRSLRERGWPGDPRIPGSIGQQLSPGNGAGDDY